jgi:pimeloyl-ACP methyl ester carboxylesterase
MPLVQRGAHAIHYQALGDPASPPLLLIMGLAVSSRAWDRLPELMAPRFHVLVFDNRGTGRSSRHGFRYRMRDLADDAAAVIEASGAPSAHVFGISMGGMIAQELALRHPERVRSLALGCTFACWRKARAPAWRTKLDLLLLNLGRTAVVPRLLVSPEWHAKHPSSALDWIRRAERTTLRAALAQLIAVGRHNTLGRLAQIRAPTLVLTGDADRLIPPQNSEVLAAAIPGARLVTLPGAGHAFPLEREEETVRALTDHFLSAETHDPRSVA